MFTKGKSQSRPTPKFALVKWLTGEDRGKYSTVDSSWLLNFSMEDYDSKKCESYIVEWRDQKKQPLGGWPCFDAQVVNLSDLKSVLEKELSQILQEKEKSRPGNSGNTNKRGFPELLCVTNSDDSIVDPTYHPSPEHGDIDSMQKSGKQEGDSSFIDDRDECEVSYRKKYKRIKKELEVLKKEYDDLKSENARLKFQLADEIPSMLGCMRDMVSSMEKRPAAPSSRSEPPAEVPSEKIEIFPGSRVFVDAAAWLSAKSCSTAGSFVGRLLVSLFPREVLMRSNLKGGAPKAPSAAGKERKERLDPMIIAAIKGAAKTQYPELKDSNFGVYVNQKIANLRSKEKAKEAKAEEEKEKDKEDS